MHTELYNGKIVMDAIDCLISNGKKDLIPKWLRRLDYIFTFLYLVVYTLIVVMILRRFL